MLAVHFSSRQTDPASPGKGSKTVVPHDTNYVQAGEVVRRLWVLAAGDVAFIGYDGVTDTWTVSAGMLPFPIDIAITVVKSTGTTVTAGNLKAIL